MITSKDSKRITEVIRLANEHALTSERAAAAYSAHMTLYILAAGVADASSMEQERITLHNLLDNILDAGAMVGQLSKERDALFLKYGVPVNR